MHRFYVPHEQISGNTITITGSDVNHIKNVLRLKADDQIEVFDSKGNSYLAEITSYFSNNQRLNAAVIERLGNRDVQSQVPDITLAQCLPKAKKMDFIVQKATELGVSSIIPVISERSVPKIEDKAEKKISHWQKIAKEAAEQSGRVKVPQVKELIKFDDLIKTAKNYTLALLPWEGEQKNTLKNCLILKFPSPQTLVPQFPSILITIGPEGGYSHKEVEQANNAGFKTISLGKRILRTETAGIVVLSQIIYELEN